MGQKVHPIGFRVGITKKHQSEWFAKTSNYSQLVIEDYFLRKSIFESFNDAGIVDISIQRKLEQVRIKIRAARPKLLLGHQGNDLKILKKNLEQKLQEFRLLHKKNSFLTNEKRDTNQKIQIVIHVIKVANPGLEAAFIVDFVVEQLEKRIEFRRAIKQAIQRAQKAGVKGIKIQVSGRLNGAEIARSEWVRKGRVPLQTLRADIDYSYKTAKTIYGLLGIKVWIFKGLSEKL
jgi:small subunit ribosomal protein S3